MTDKCICTTLRQAAHASTAYYDQVLAPSGLKVTMFRLLRRMADMPDATITALAETVGLDRSTLGRNLKVLEKQGFVTLSPSKDGRARKVEISKEGKVALEHALPLWRNAQASMTSAIGTTLDDLLIKLDRLQTLRTSHQEPRP